MSKPVQSIWTVTFDKGGANELALVTPGLLLEDEFDDFAAQQVVEDGDYVEADESSPLAFGNVKRSLSVTVYREHASPAAAREHRFTADLAIPPNVTAPLTVEIDGGATYVLDACAFSSWRTVLVRTRPNTTATTYQLKCGPLSVDAVAGPDPIGLETAAVSVSRTSITAAHDDALATWTNSGTGDDATQATAGERPRVVKGKGIYHPGVALNAYYTPHHATLNGGNNFALRWDGVLPSYTPAARVCLMSKWNTSGNVRSYALFLEPSGKVTLAVSTDGTAGTITEWTSTAAVGLAGGTYCGIQAIKNVTGLSFYLYQDSGWSGLALGPQQTIANLTAFAGTADLMVGGSSSGADHILEGFSHRAQLWTTATWFANSTLFLANFVPEAGVTGVSPTTTAFARSGVDTMRSIGGTEKAFPRFDGSDDNLGLATEPVKLNTVSGATLAWKGFLGRVSGTNDLIHCGTNAANPRALLRVNGGDLQLLVRRLDGEATATITAAAAVAQYFEGSLSASIDYAAGTATIYKDGNPLVTGTLTSAGTTSATDSSETVIMAGAAGANPAAGDVSHVVILEQASTPFEMAALLAAMVS